MPPQLPPIFLERLKAIIPPESYENVLSQFSRPRPPVYRINTLKISEHQFVNDLDVHNVPYQKILFVSGAVAVDKDIPYVAELVEKGCLYRQGISSMLVIKALGPQPDEKILDMCAAPGSKTTQMSAAMNNTGEIVAVEHIRARLYKLRSVVGLLGAANVSVKFTDARRFKSTQLFDRILVDAPCSSEGRFEVGKPKSIGYWSPRKIKEMAHKQKGILNSAGRLLKKGGVLVYSTCTFAPEENEEVVDWFLRKNKNAFEVQKIHWDGVDNFSALARWGKREFDPQVQNCFRIQPSPWLEGFFIAKIVKR